MGLAGAPGSARAWTDAHVQGVRTHVEVRPDGSARVAMELSVRIHGGWLEGLEVVGLDRDFVLDETKPPYAVSADDPSIKFAPQVRAEADRLAFSFRGRNASPRRGSLTVGFLYTTSLAHRGTEARGEDTVRVRWALPPWRSGLDGATIALTVPGQAEAVVDGGGAHGAVEVEQVDLGDRTLIVWERSHLPRTVAWPVAVDVPSEAMAEALRTPARPSRGKRPVADATPQPSPWGPIALAAALASLALVGRFTFARACRARGAAPRPLIPLGSGAFAVLVAAGSAFAGWIWLERADLALASLAAVALLTLQRTPHRTGHVARIGRWRAATPADRRSASRAPLAGLIGVETPVDVTTLFGITVVAAAIAAALTAASGAPLVPSFVPALVLLAVPALTATRAHLPTSARSRLRRLTRLARTLRVTDGTPAAAFSLVVHEELGLAVSDARLRITIGDELLSGLRSIDLALGDRPDLGGHRVEPVLLAVARASSDAAAALAPLAARRVGAGDRVAFTFAPSQLADVLAALTATAAAAPLGSESEAA